MKYHNGRVAALISIISLIVLLNCGDKTPNDSNTNNLGLKWTIVADSALPSGVFNGVEWRESVFMFAGGKGQYPADTGVMMVGSTYGVPIDFIVIPAQHTILGFGYNDTIFVTMGPEGTAYLSYNGSFWAEADAYSARLGHVSWGPGIWLAVTDSNNCRIMISSDGLDWHCQYIAVTSERLMEVIWADSLYIGVGIGGQIMASDISRSTWTIPASTTTENLCGITWGAGKFVAVGENGSIVYSSDGASWHAAETNITENLYDVIWTQHRFIAVGGSQGQSGIIMTSENGIDWVQRFAISGRALFCIESNGTVSIAAGEKGIIIRSS
jgi:hypothetical protein